MTNVLMQCFTWAWCVWILHVVVTLSCSDLCSVNLQDYEGLSLQIEKKNVDTFCELRMDAVVQEKIVMPAGSKANLSFLDCPKDDLVLTATQTMGSITISIILFGFSSEWKFVFIVSRDQARKLDIFKVLHTPCLISPFYLLCL